MWLKRPSPCQNSYLGRTRKKQFRQLGNRHSAGQLSEPLVKDVSNRTVKVSRMHDREITLTSFNILLD
jgi:hypothetical protein